MKCVSLVNASTVTTEHVILQSQNWQFDPRLLRPHVKVSLGNKQDTEPQVSPRTLLQGCQCLLLLMLRDGLNAEINESHCTIVSFLLYWFI